MAFLGDSNIERDVQRLRPLLGGAGPGGGAAWIGRRDGPHAGLFVRVSDGALASWSLEVVDGSNVPFLSAGAEDTFGQTLQDEHLNQWLYLGYADRPNVRLAWDVDSGWRLVVDPETLARLLDERDIDVARVVGGIGMTAIADADGSLGDVTTKFNTLLAELRTAGLLKV